MSERYLYFPCFWGFPKETKYFKHFNEAKMFVDKLKYLRLSYDGENFCKWSGIVGVWNKEKKLLYKRKLIAEKCLDYINLKELREDLCPSFTM